MYCGTCPRLKAEYEHSVRLYRAAVIQLDGTLVNDAETARETAELLHVLAQTAHRELIRHLKAEHWHEAAEQPC